MTHWTFEDDVDLVLYDAYRAAFGRRPSHEWLKAITMRVGTTGEVATLEEAGAAIGVTRERVRQVMSRIKKELKGKTPPRAKDVAQVLVSHSPVHEPIGRRL